MARPTKNDIDSGIQSWDGKIDDNDEALFNGPLPVHEHTGDESDLASTFAAAAFDRCTVMVDHTTLGWSYYVSDGAAWNRMGAMEQTPTVVDLTNANGTGDDALVDVTATFSQTILNNNFKDVTDKIAEITSALRDHGFIL